MGKIKVEKNKNFTIMSNYHLRDKNLSNKARGLLSTILSLPDDWNYTVEGLASICKDGKGSISTQIKELEACGYLIRTQTRDELGRISDTEYTIYELPPYVLELPPESDEPYDPTSLDISPTDMAIPEAENPVLGYPYPGFRDMDFPDTDFPVTENPEELNIDIQNTDLQITDLQNTPSIYLVDDGRMGGVFLRRAYEHRVKANLDYDLLVTERNYDASRLQGIVDIILDAVCSTRPTLRVNGEDIPQAYVKERLLTLNNLHIDYVYDLMAEGTKPIRNIKAYLLTLLYNAPVTMDNYFAARVQHDYHLHTERLVS